MIAAFFVGLGLGLVAGVVGTVAFGRKVTSAFANALTKTAAKVEPKN